MHLCWIWRAWRSATRCGVTRHSAICARCDTSAGMRRQLKEDVHPIIAILLAENGSVTDPRAEVPVWLAIRRLLEQILSRAH